MWEPITTLTIVIAVSGGGAEGLADVQPGCVPAHHRLEAAGLREDFASRRGGGVLAVVREPSRGERGAAGGGGAAACPPLRPLEGALVGGRVHGGLRRSAGRARGDARRAHGHRQRDLTPGSESVAQSLSQTLRHSGTQALRHSGTQAVRQAL
eukprot:9398155-Pyramimonas_sp.AAC.1